MIDLSEFTVERFTMLLAHLKNLDDGPDSKLGFDMKEWYAGRDDTKHECGTACCLAGHAEYLFGGDHGCFDISMGITMHCSHKISMPMAILSDIKLNHAVLMIEKLLETGYIDWACAGVDFFHMRKTKCDSV